MPLQVFCKIKNMMEKEEYYYVRTFKICQY